MTCVTAAREGTAEIGTGGGRHDLAIVAVFVPVAFHGQWAGPVVQALRPSPSSPRSSCPC